MLSLAFISGNISPQCNSLGLFVLNQSPSTSAARAFMTHALDITLSITRCRVGFNLAIIWINSPGQSGR